MTAAVRYPPVEPALFQRVVEYADQIKAHKIRASDYVKKTTGIVIFCQSFFEQFTHNVLGETLEAFDDESKVSAVDLRLDLGDGYPERRRLIAQFEALCDLWDGSLGFDYDNSTDDVVEFHKQYLPDLLDDIVLWCEAEGYSALCLAAAAARDAYKSALPEFLR